MPNSVDIFGNEIERRIIKWLSSPNGATMVGLS